MFSRSIELLVNGDILEFWTGDLFNWQWMLENKNFIIIKLRSRKNENYSESYIFEIYMYTYVHDFQSFYL